MRPFLELNHIKIYNKDCRDMSELPDESVDLLATDPPYGISFMGKDWDKALPDKQIWRECLRVLKPGAFAFVMSIPRADCLSRMIISLEDVGFRVDFSPIYWAYASGFPKAQNIGKAVDKRLGAEREVVGKKECGYQVSISKKRKEEGYRPNLTSATKEVDITAPSTPQAKALDGSYGGFQPKPAVEVIIVAMKPLSEKTFVDQALKNRKGITWLGDCMIPYQGDKDTEVSENKNRHADFGSPALDNQVFGQDHRPRSEQGNYSAGQGRFPANLLVSDDVLNDGRVHKTGDLFGSYKHGGGKNDYGEYGFSDHAHHADSGSFSRYFDLDKWWAKTFPFLIVPKASKSEKNKGLGATITRTKHGSTPRENEAENKSPNNHPTVKPVKLMSYLITLGSREGDIVLDNFGGSGTTPVAATLLNRKCIMYEIGKENCKIAAARCQQQGLL